MHIVVWGNFPFNFKIRTSDILAFVQPNFRRVHQNFKCCLLYSLIIDLMITISNVFFFLIESYPRKKQTKQNKEQNKSHLIRIYFQMQSNVEIVVIQIQNYTERQMKLITSSERRSLKSTASN